MKTAFSDYLGRERRVVHDSDIPHQQELSCKIAYLAHFLYLFVGMLNDESVTSFDGMDNGPQGKDVSMPPAGFSIYKGVLGRGTRVNPLGCN